MPQILILESDRQLASQLKEFLELKNFKVNAFSDPQAAISSMDKSCPDLVVVGLMLAGHSAIEFLHELRSYPEWQEVKAIVVGSLGNDELKRYQDPLKHLKVDMYLNRSSISANSLSSSIQQLLQPQKV